MMTLEEVLPAVRELSLRDKLELIRVIAADLVESQIMWFFEPNRTVEIWTPYNTYGAATILAQKLAESPKEQSED